MANKEQLASLKEDVRKWNKWREKNPDTEVNLSGADFTLADLSDVDLSGADLRDSDFNGAFLSRSNLCRAILNGAYLSGATLIKANLQRAQLIAANLSEARLNKADLSGADLSGADLREAVLRGADLIEARLSNADLSRASLSDADLSDTDLSEANLSGAFLSRTNLSGAILSRAILVGTHLQEANLTDCRIYGISAWDVNLERATQKNLVITEYGEPTVTVDDLEVAQFIYLMLNNQKIKNVIDTITSKAVLILGRFTEERKKVLDAIREELRQRGYVPILFDFEPSDSRNLTETVTLLARMARFIIADLSDPKSIPQELTSIIPNLPSVPVQPIILSSQREYAMYENWTEYRWVLKIHKYKGVGDLLADIPAKVIDPAEKFLLKKKSKKQELMFKRPKK